jgi:nucleoside-diphosphate-sugar epimerase
MKSVIVFGGSGFVGTHLVPFLLQKYEKVFIADIKTPCWHPGTTLPNDSRIEYVTCDVRNQIDKTLFGDTIDCIINLAAVHTSPGHPAHEYFEANIKGATNICAYAQHVRCEKIVFTSSISIYGPGEDEKNETLIPMPSIPYGSSKIVAEYIHREWFNEQANYRMLTIVRPGVIFGKGEGGNFTRIANTLERGIFAYPGRSDTIKACLYVKDICKFILEATERKPGFCTFNFCYPEKVTIKRVVQTFKKVLGYKAPEVIIPFKVITSCAAVVNKIPLPFIKKMGLVPDRLVKLIKSTNISSQKLVQSGFVFQYTLEEALKDWSNDCGGKTLY